MLHPASWQPCDLQPRILFPSNPFISSAFLKPSGLPVSSDPAPFHWRSLSPFESLPYVQIQEGHWKPAVTSIITYILDPICQSLTTLYFSSAFLWNFWGPVHQTTSLQSVVSVLAPAFLFPLKRETFLTLPSNSSRASTKTCVFASKHVASCIEEGNAWVWYHRK